MFLLFTAVVSFNVLKFILRISNLCQCWFNFFNIYYFQKNRLCVRAVRFCYSLFKNNEFVYFVDWIKTFLVVPGYRTFLCWLFLAYAADFIHTLCCSWLISCTIVLILCKLINISYHGSGTSFSDKDWKYSIRNLISFQKIISDPPLYNNCTTQIDKIGSLTFTVVITIHIKW